ncbi:MAG TPA: 2OG-Fe(II) oxygenase family protein [Kiloniellales bacterium]|nr:2OG-Fe(II) oxygenase family protein [Kiloniellales bacterium]
MIPIIDIASLFGPSTPSRDSADAAIMAAAESSGFAVITGLPPSMGTTSAERQELLRFFSLSKEQKQCLARQKFTPENPNVYRGYFPTQEGTATYKEGIDLGPDLLDPSRAQDHDPLREATPLPDSAALPGWREAAANYYRAMDATGRVLLSAIARGLELPEETLAAPFTGGISTLRLLRYPPRQLSVTDAVEAEEMTVVHMGERRFLAGKAHVDSGFITLLQQHGVSGLQAQLRDGQWHDIQPCEGSLVINFGKLLERWTGGRVKATVHRILANPDERFSIPFFYEPRADARIAPLPLPNAERFEPFTYGDHLWSAMTRFVEFQGLEHLRMMRTA